MEENIDSLEARLLEIWQILRGKGIDLDHMLSKSLLSPATVALSTRMEKKPLKRPLSLSGNCRRGSGGNMAFYKQDPDFRRFPLKII